ncbi:MAG: cell division protein FtsB [Gammaproteobacteria bacterium]|nr:cell division protein FtsB [Gammaproteobacteria bacterium]
MNIEQRKLHILLFVLLLMLIGLQIALWFSNTGLRNLNKLESDVSRQTLENSDLELRNQTLEAEVKDLKEGLDSVEERARSELGMIAEDETFFLLVDKNKPNQIESDEITQVESTGPEE